VLLSTLRRAARVNPDIRVVEHGLDDGESAPIDAVEARVIEGGDRLRAIPVRPATHSGFQSFLNGIQRAQIRLYHDTVPIVYAYGAAAIRQRRAQRMTAHPAGLLVEREAIFFPFVLLDPARVRALGVPADQMIDTSPQDGESLPLFPPALYARAAESINLWRETIEREVALQWCALAPRDEWLLVDGRLTGSPELAASAHTAGLIRSQRTRFFDGHDARTLLGLRKGERTSVFEPLTRRWTPVHSWYVRLHDPAGHDPLWGLVRVEVAADSESVQKAEQLSGWLLCELAPLAVSETRWDRLLYPIHDCERFLRARAPSLHN
jgi:hypothetical protein